MNLVDNVLVELRSYRLSILNDPSLTANDVSTQFPLFQVLAYYQQVGKHFVDQRVLVELTEIKAILDQQQKDSLSTKMLHFFVEMSLDKHLGYYSYDSYTGARFLRDISIDPGASFQEYAAVRSSHLILLLCDIAMFECKTILGEEPRLPDFLIPYHDRRKRILNTLRAILAYRALTDRLVLTDEIDTCVSLLSQEQTDTGVSLSLYRRICSALDAIMAQLPVEIRTICTITMEPVWTAHDEYMFIRILQSFETIFSIIVKGFLICQEYLDRRDYKYATVVIDELSSIFQHNAFLFRILTSMPPDSFAIFREYTEGSSAIQSEQYKLIEALCAHPARTRMHSAAFDSVPQVKADYENGDLRCFEDIFTYGEHNWEDPDFLGVVESMLAFEEHFMRWKKMHLNIAVKMIGTLPGTGYTPGSPYLKANVETRLFPYLSPLPEKQEALHPAVDSTIQER